MILSLQRAFQRSYLIPTFAVYVRCVAESTQTLCACPLNSGGCGFLLALVGTQVPVGVCTPGWAKWDIWHFSTSTLGYAEWNQATPICFSITSFYCAELIQAGQEWGQVGRREFLWLRPTCKNNRPIYTSNKCVLQIVSRLVSVQEIWERDASKSQWVQLSVLL